ncbi:hypothetical protein [Halomarina ordinaria]|uniref:Uncharacterized protein n=1 Tax=Halomarina ordinaria TaxID=3033939 RepID=A0ABD5UBF0_9EURY|nr:hypothetical protein [Halomarina sp. PSRA2]
MDQRLIPGVRLLLLQLLALDALIHLADIAPNLAAVLQSGATPRTTTVLIALSVVAIVVGVLAVWAGLLSYRTAYALAAALMLAEIVAWLVVHNTSLGHTHDASLLVSTVQHFVGEPIETAAKTAEAIALVLAVYLFRVDAAATTYRTSSVRRLLAREE